MLREALSEVLERADLEYLIIVSSGWAAENSSAPAKGCDAPETEDQDLPLFTYLDPEDGTLRILC
jgi:hypothetical protein